MAESLNPTLITRISRAVRPDWTRTLLARRVVAGALVVLAGIAAIRPDPQSDRTGVVVASRDVGPGAELTVDDVKLESRPATTVPDGASADLAGVLGARLAGPARRGEVLTDVRVLGRQLVEATAGRDARIVGLHPADGALADLLRPGDVVDVVAAAGGAAQTGAGDARVLAVGGIVVLVSQSAKDAAAERVVLVALPAAAATAVAGAALTEKVTLTLR